MAKTFKQIIEEIKHEEKGSALQSYLGKAPKNWTRDRMRYLSKWAVFAEIADFAGYEIIFQPKNKGYDI